ncbi:hypothetical protein MFIFM68171_06299 [Madurella fahalii]|uniref:Uncharacterized protein n=1 Tax=Madurella fahalii TaxID=1157608 RepID=A0ABQ0GE93_9PEZI
MLIRRDYQAPPPPASVKNADFGDILVKLRQRRTRLSKDPDRNAKEIKETDKEIHVVELEQEKMRHETTLKDESISEKQRKATKELLKEVDDKLKELEHPAPAAGDIADGMILQKK